MMMVLNWRNFPDGITSKHVGPAWLICTLTKYNPKNLKIDNSIFVPIDEKTGEGFMLFLVSKNLIDKNVHFLPMGHSLIADTQDTQVKLIKLLLETPDKLFKIKILVDENQGVVYHYYDEFSAKEILNLAVVNWFTNITNKADYNIFSTDWMGFYSEPVDLSETLIKNEILTENISEISVKNEILIKNPDQNWLSNPATSSTGE